MTRPTRSFVGSEAVWRPLAPFAALFVLLILFAVGGMLVIAYEADRSDAARAREAVARSFSGIVSRLVSAAEMNAGTPQIAGSLSDPHAAPASAYGYFNFTNSEALGYYGTVILDQDGSAFAGTYRGLPWTGTGLTAAAKMISAVAARLPARGSGTVHAIVRDTSGRALAIAVANVGPGAGDLDPGRATGPPRRLAMIAPVVQQLIPKMLPSLGVEDFRVVATSHDDNATVVRVERGPPLVLTWRPRTPGREAIARWAPAIGILLLSALVMLALAGRMSIAATRALEQLAHHDSLTGLANRAAFRKELDRRLARGDPVALGMIDLNDFKAVNDRHGHAAGDALLQAVAAELTGSSGLDDLVARLGGDEFAWVSETHEAAVSLSVKFSRRLAGSLLVEGLHLKVGAAVGIASRRPGSTASALMAVADAQLYANKRTAKRV